MKSRTYKYEMEQKPTKHIYLQIEDFMSQFQYELGVWGVHIHWKVNSWLGCDFKSNNKGGSGKTSSLGLDNMWIRDKLTEELNSQKMRVLKIMEEDKELKELGVWHLKGRHLRNVW